jgi:heme-degrading monooxygenase HmoA
MALRHIVLFRFHEGVDPASREAATQLLRGLGGQPGILNWRVELSTDSRKGHVVAQDFLFESQEAFQEFRKSDAHTVTAGFMRTIADWWIADFAD